MRATPRYKRTPIVEADLDIRVDPLVNSVDLRELTKSESARYPRIEELISYAWRFEPGPLPKLDSSTSIQGFRAWSADQLQVYQARPDGFTFGRLAPYSDFPAIRDEARRLWGVYQQLGSPGRITRLALRYINRIDLPVTISNLHDYFRIMPNIPPELSGSQPPAHFLSQVVVKTSVPDVWATVTLTPVVPPFDQPVVSLALDLDLACTVNIPQDEPGIWMFFDSLRDVKNQVFEASITDQTREQFR